MLNGGLGINLADYQNAGLTDQVLFGNANTTQEQLNDLSKALEAQSITGGQSLNLTSASGAPLKVESLDRNLKVTTFKESEIKLYKSIPKDKAYNTVEEYNQLTSYGAERGGFVLEGELPKEEDSTYIRKSELVKYLGVTKSVTHQMTLVNTMIGDVIDREVKNGTLYILKKLNRALAEGNASYVTEEFNGLYAQHYSSDYADLNAYLNNNPNVVDLRGGVLEEKHIEDAQEGIVENHGLGNMLFGAPKVISTFAKNFYGNKFIMPNTAQISDGRMGQRVKAFESQFGDIELNFDVFLNKPSSKAYNAATTAAEAPGAVTGGSVNAIGATSPNTKWTSSDNGDYYFGVVAVNRFGEGAMTILNPMAAATIVIGGAADLLFTAPAGANAATCFDIYRSEKNPAALATATFYKTFTVSVAQKNAGYDGAALAGRVRDNNRFLPNTYKAFLVQNDEECWMYRQLAPLMKMDLAVVSPAYRFMVLMYGTMLMFAPKKVSVFLNIGQ
jgi:hypothetical protein